MDQRIWRVVGDPLVPGGTGPLAGESIAVKDLFSVAGQRVGAGVPAYLAGSPTCSESAPAVQRLLDAGAALRGIAQTDQFAYSLAGDNDWYGTPPNAGVPGALPGGSSSGSASAVALGEASLGLGTDTAGSIRVPASYQGLWGLRTTHGAVSMTGVLGLAPEFDTAGLLAGDGGLLARAAAVLLGDVGRVEPEPGLLVAPAVTAAAEDDVRAAFDSWVPRASEVELPPLADVAEAFRVHQAYQAWRLHGPWLTKHPGALKGAAAQRFAAASAVTAEQDTQAAAALVGYRDAMESVLGGRVLLLPSAASAAPRLDAGAAAVDRLRAAMVRLTCLAAVLGRPALSAPLLSTAAGPVGVSLLGPPGSDLALVSLGLALQRDLRPRR